MWRCGVGPPLPAGLPTELRRQVVGCVGRGILRQLPLLSSCGAVAPGLAAELAGALRVEFHPAGECVVMEVRAGVWSWRWGRGRKY